MSDLVLSSQAMTDVAPAPPAPSRRSPLRLALGWTVVLVILAVGALLIIGARENHRSHALGGDFLLTDTAASWTLDQPCSGSGGYSDIQPGLGVTVSDGAGKVIGTGSLGAGVADSDTTCSFPIAVPAVPQVDFYKVAVGHRGEITQSKAELKANAWQVEFTLGP